MVKELAFRWRAWRNVRQAEHKMRVKARAARKAGHQKCAGHQTAPRPGVRPAGLRVPRAAALAAISVLVGGASTASFAESYRGLYIWAHEHGLTGVWAAGFPLQVDVFIAVGELALFVALADSWERRSRIGAWLVTLAGLAVSVAGNVGHVHGHLLSDRATAAVPPLAAAAALAVGLGVLKRVVAHHGQAAGPVSIWHQPGLYPAPTTHHASADAQSAAVAALRATTAAGNPLSGRQLESRFGLNRSEVTRVREIALAESNGHP